MVTHEMVFQMYCTLVASGKEPDDRTQAYAHSIVKNFNDTWDEDDLCDECGLKDCDGWCH